MGRPEPVAPEDQPGVATPKPGAQLKAAREGRSLSLAEMANRLHLDTRIVSALEADAYERLPDSAYVRGYIRSYARQLDLDAEPLIDAYNAQVGEPQAPVIRPYSSKPAAQASYSDRPVKAVTYFVAVGLLVLLVAWWQSQHGDRSPTLPVEDAELFADPAPAPAPGSVERRTEVEDSALGYSYTVVDHPDTLPPARTPGAAGPTAEPIAEPMLAPLPEPSWDSFPEPQAEARFPAMEAGIEPAASESPAAAADGGGHRLVLRLSNDSWIEITDGNGERLFFNLGKAGQTIEVSGPPPLRVLLGYAVGMEARHNGQPFDLAPHTRNGVARFVLGEAAPDRP